jgi:uncharacterized protein YqgQ
MRNYFLVTPRRELVHFTNRPAISDMQYILQAYGFILVSMGAGQYSYEKFAQAISKHFSVETKRNQWAVTTLLTQECASS